ncbi:MAG: carbohydrate porin [Alphaproteobacteria bacterium]|nr:carbohydrate porin [Alphaproteobacteria bacterium]
MIKYISLLALTLSISTQANASSYFDIKEQISQKYNLKLGLNTSITNFYTSKNNITKEFYTPYLYKELFQTKNSQATLNFSLNNVRFSPITPINSASFLGIANLFDSYDTNYNELYELYYAHTIKLPYTIELGVGQIPISKFDTQTRSPIQIQHFNNNSLYQNGSFTYPTAGLGSYVSIDNNKDFSISLGAIDATNPYAQGFKIKNISKFDFSSFLSFNYYPKIKNKYQSSYSILLYDKPNVSKAPTTSRGLSLSLLQDISNNKSIFFKYNTSNGNYSIIKNSYSVGLLYHLQEDNVLAIGYSLNRINDTNAVHKNEEVLEAYYKYNLTPSLSIKPDIEIYTRPAYKSSSETIFSLTLTLGI